MWMIVVIYYLICSRLLHCKRIYPNSKEKNIAYLQMCADHYMFNDMRKILINNIKIHMNIRCAEMTSREITNLTILVELQNVKTFYEKNMQQRGSISPPISTKQRITSHLKSLNISINCLLSVGKQFGFFSF